MRDESKGMLAVVVIMVLVVVALGLFFLTRDPALNNGGSTTSAAITTSNTVTSNTGSAVTSSRTFTLTAQNNSGQTGTVVLEEAGTQMRVTISLANPTTTPQPAHIHVGSCPTPGDVLIPLQDVVNGSSVSLVDTNFASLQNAGALAINVHKSASESSLYYACGNLDF